MFRRKRWLEKFAQGGAGYHATVLAQPGLLVDYQYDEQPFTGLPKDSGPNGFHIDADAGGDPVTVPGHIQQGLSYGPGCTQFQHSFTAQADANLFQGATISVITWLKWPGVVTPASGSISQDNPTGAQQAWFLAYNIALDSFDVALNNSHGGSTPNSVAVPRDGNWHMLVWTYNGAGRSKLYLDGALGDDVAAPFPDLACAPDAQARLLFQRGDVYWDETAVFSTELAASLISALATLQ